MAQESTANGRMFVWLLSPPRRPGRKEMTWTATEHHVDIVIRSLSCNWHPTASAIVNKLFTRVLNHLLSKKSAFPKSLFKQLFFWSFSLLKSWRYPLGDRNLEIQKKKFAADASKKKCSARLRGGSPQTSWPVMTFVTKSWPGHDFWSPTQPILSPRHEYGHEVMTRHDVVMTLSHELKSRDLKPLTFTAIGDTLGDNFLTIIFLTAIGDTLGDF